MRLLKLLKSIVNINPRPGFKVHSIIITVETDAGVQDQLQPKEIPPEGRRYLFIETAVLRVHVEFDPPDDLMDEVEIWEDSAEDSPKELVYKFKITGKSPSELRFDISETECFLIYLYAAHQEIPDLEKFYVEVELKESLEAKGIFGNQNKEFCEGLIQRYLGPEKGSDKNAPVKILSSGSLSLSSIATDDPLYTLVELTDGTTILAEHFQHEGIPRRRPIQVRIPLWTILGKGKFNDQTNKGVAALPLSILSGWGKGKLEIDQEYNEGGEYDKGHLMPSASGAPHNSYIIVPMLQYMNQSGGWKQMERKLGRFLYNLSGNYTKSKPREGEQELAAAFHGCYRQRDQRLDCYFRIIISYDGAQDPRIPTGFSATLNRVKDRMTLEDFGGEMGHFDAEQDQDEASEELKQVFELAVKELEILDQKYKTGWDPLQNWKSPPREFPEWHLPRPYRALDLLVSNKQLFKKALEVLEESEEEKELLTDVWATKIGSGFGFSAAQRKLAILFNRWKNEGSFLSDLRKGAVTVHKDIQHLYVDPITELKPWGGNEQAQADHHVPKSTASGTNYFTNLLYISRQQNLRKETQNKPFKLTNPNFAGKIEIYKPPEISGVKKQKQWTNEETVTRCIFKTENLSREGVIKCFLERWRQEEVMADEFLINVAGNFWDDWFVKKRDPLPWTSEAEELSKQGKKLFWK